MDVEQEVEGAPAPRTPAAPLLDPEDVAPRSGRRRAAYTLLVGGLVVASTAVSLQAGVPDRLPGVALGSETVLHLERAVTVFALLFLVLLAFVRAFEGELPQELSGRGVKYASSDAVEELRGKLAKAIALHDASIGELEKAQEDLDERLPAHSGESTSPRRVS